MQTTTSKGPDQMLAVRRGAGRTSTMSAARAAAAIGVAILTVVVGLAVAGPASAHGPTVDGCTAVPDSGYGFDFHEMCDDHDRCYGTKPHGDGWRGRRTCDREFRAAMYDHCDQHDRFSARRISCDAVATAYYLGVRTFGWFYWQQSISTTIA
ncbi:MAG: phospholipase A2 [Actinomycetota bacterium]